MPDGHEFVNSRCSICHLTDLAYAQARRRGVTLQCKGFVPAADSPATAPPGGPSAS